MLGVLVVVFRRHRIARTLRVARELKIFFRDVRRRSADFHVRSVGLVDPRQWILMVMMMCHRLCGFDPACACSDRFSWFAVPPTPDLGGTDAAVSLYPNSLLLESITGLQPLRSRRDIDANRAVALASRSAS